MGKVTPEMLKKLQERTKNAKRKPDDRKIAKKALPDIQEESRLHHASVRKLAAIKREKRLEAKKQREEKKNPPYVPKPVNWDKINQILYDLEP